MPVTRRPGSSIAAKWPPRSNSGQCMMLLDSSASRRIAAAISRGNTATPVGAVEGPGRPQAPLRAASQ
jgi:hypothetical protein